ncbi:hypothetical protein H072_3389 [Dactylellina haptotyla CBS 200.50]|uniref:Uncharacterized protein n=1 Tax=Dactylellina haptotyla (strain CBS 200.50) TaxID=1284197 RepID=S8AI69_DACHA|nr:hypothetical protein H072_3389 [Dactylellina haptotyla CBS 200.50]
MPPQQHTFGAMGNMPSHPGVGATGSAAPTPPLQTNTQYSTPPVELGSPPAYMSPTGPSNVPTSYSGYQSQFQSPQQPAPTYTPWGSNMSPDVIATRRELLDVDALIHDSQNRLNEQLDNPAHDSVAIEQLQEESRKLYLRKSTLLQRLQDLQDPSTEAYHQSQAMTVNLAEPLMYAHGPAVESGVRPAITLLPAATKNRGAWKACIALLIIALVVIVIISVIVKRLSHR